MTTPDRSFTGVYEGSSGVEVEVTVPEDEIWYVEAIHEVRPDGVNPMGYRSIGVCEGDPSRLLIGIRGPETARVGSTDSGGQTTLSVNSYAYPGETVWVWSDGDSEGMEYTASIRRVA